MFKLTPSKFLNEDDIAKASKAFPALGPKVFNPQQQVPMTWPNDTIDSSL